MYKDQTFEILIDRMLAKVPSGVDKTEGTFIYDALAPAAMELAVAYVKLREIRNNISLDTSTGVGLTELCYQNGTFRKGATKAIRKGVFNMEVATGSRFEADDTTYVVLERIKDYEYKLQCEQLGAVGNFYEGDLVALDYIEGLETAKLTELVVEGAEEETDTQLRERHRRRLLEGEQDGNIAQYRNWAEKFGGVGKVKVFPLWDGGNTVKVSITDRLFQVADSTLINEFQRYLDPNSEGLGNGVAPIGSKVTVTGGTKKEINITGNIVLAEGYLETIGAADGVNKYFASISYSKDSVSYLRTAVAILDTPGILDLNSFTINGGIEDVPLVGDEIPFLNSINLTVVTL